MQKATLQDLRAFHSILKTGADTEYWKKETNEIFDIMDIIEKNNILRPGATINDIKNVCQSFSLEQQETLLAVVAWYRRFQKDEFPTTTEKFQYADKVF